MAREKERKKERKKKKVGSWKKEKKRKEKKRKEKKKQVAGKNRSMWFVHPAVNATAALRQAASTLTQRACGQTQGQLTQQ